MQPTLRNSDAELLSTAWSRLSQSHSALMPALHIDAEQGIVTISGRVSNRSERCSITSVRSAKFRWPSAADVFRQFQRQKQDPTPPNFAASSPVDRTLVREPADC
jgi:hypothetical protein